MAAGSRLFKPNDVGDGERVSSLKDLEKICTKTGKEPVLMQITVYTLSDIDPVTGRFRAEFNVKMWWWEKELADDAKLDEAELNAWTTKKELKVKGDDPRICVPALFFENSLSKAEDVEPASMAMRGARGVVNYERRVRATIKLEVGSALRKFPFDVQKLTIQLRINSKDDTARNRYMAFNDSKKAEIGALKLFLRPQLKVDVYRQDEWRVMRPAVGLEKDGKKGKRYYNVHLILRRKHWYYTNNVMFMVFVINTMAFGAYSVPCDSDNFEGRATVVLSLLLTTVAFKFVVADLMPKVSYFTFLDAYLLFGLLAVSLIFVESAVVLGLPIEQELRDSVDQYAMICLSAVYTFGHFAAIGCVYLYQKRVDAALAMDEPPPDEMTGRGEDTAAIAPPSELLVQEVNILPCNPLQLLRGFCAYLRRGCKKPPPPPVERRQSEPHVADVTQTSLRFAARLKARAAASSAAEAAAGVSATVPRAEAKAQGAKAAEPKAEPKAAEPKAATVDVKAAEPKAAELKTATADARSAEPTEKPVVAPAAPTGATPQPAEGAAKFSSVAPSSPMVAPPPAAAMRKYASVAPSPGGPGAVAAQPQHRQPPQTRLAPIATGAKAAPSPASYGLPQVKMPPGLSRQPQADIPSIAHFGNGSLPGRDAWTSPSRRAPGS